MHPYPPRRWRGCCALVQSFVLAAALALPAAAQEPADPEGYRVLIEEALAERSLGHYPESRALFAKAHSLLPSARTLRGLGLTDYDLRNYPEAVRNLSAALASDVKPLEGELRVEVEDVLAHARNFVGSYTLSLEPPDARLLMDDVPVELTTDRTLIVGAGDHLLQVQAAGYQSLRQHLVVRGGEHENLSLVLVSLAAERAPRGEPSERPWYKRAWIWTTVAVVATGAATAAALVARREEAADAPLYGGTSGVVIDAR